MAIKQTQIFPLEKNLVKSVTFNVLNEHLLNSNAYPRFPKHHLKPRTVKKVRMKMRKEKQSIIFLPGAWNGPEYFGAVIAQLKERGYELHALHLPTAGLDPKSTPVDDISLFRKQRARWLMRLAQSEQDGIGHLVYLAGLLGTEGEILVENVPEWVKFQGVWTTVENARDIFYNDLPASMADELAAKLLPHAASIYTHPLAYAGQKNLPATYLLYTQN
ncbi:uncharacterized protein BDCG_03981 [Blastomyces dermatitidis ER-3]|uniref:Uncharacterized protein n=2 Tax=Ajellomyces dermatitidis TaxID=5039 RepID=F2TEU5_AJEDA|nr:uncharacterized protein BDCG_03981 [Blastomyces dermatitidis ER-3]EEQ88861.2 hypothetical protein BDCG_03981 [Blastomyces dermatitidis ER-3]EGE81730.2 hypothetical protein BDDG_04673 [Blastomyces dermatitidis ATCC 18188]